MKKQTTLLVFLLLCITTMAQDYFPINSGSYWTYNSIRNGQPFFTGDSIYYSGKNQMRDTLFYNFSESNLENETATITDSLFLYHNFTDKNTIMQSKRLHDGLADSTVYAKHTFTDGEWWVSKNTTHDTITVTFIGTLTVSAGTFDSCYQTSNGFIFAPRVGIIRKFISAFSDSTWYDLVRYHIAPPSESTIISQTTYTGLIIYPIPAHDQVFINRTVSLRYTIISQNGSILQSGNTNQNQIDISALEKGIYLLRIYAKDGIKVQKIIKQ